MRNKLFMKEQLLQKKDNIIKSLQLNLEQVAQEKKVNGAYVIEKFILEPSEWNVNFQKEIQKRD